MPTPVELLAHHGASQPVALSGDIYGFPVVFMYHFSDVTLDFVMKTTKQNKNTATTTTVVRTLTITAYNNNSSSGLSL